jgi:hypothetical protein
MDIDLAVLRSLEREKEIPFDLLVEAIESALLIAYHKTDPSITTHGSSSIAGRDTSRSSLRRSMTTATSSTNGTTPPRTSAGSPPQPPSR